MFQKEYSKALPMAEKINAIFEAHHLDNLYHNVQPHCLLGNREKGEAWLHRAIDTGFWDAKRMREDSLLSLIKGDEYVKILNRTAYGRELQKGLVPGGRRGVIDYILKPWEERLCGAPPEQQVI